MSNPTTRSPLYNFHIDDNKGEFRPSPRCERLRESVLEVMVRMEGRPESDNKVDLLTLEGTLRVNPDMICLKAFLAERQAELAEDSQARFAAMAELKSVYLDAKKLIPGTFRGTVSSYVAGNDWYFSMMASYLQIIISCGQFAEAVPVARKILQHNPSDTYGVRLIVPVLLLILQDAPGAMRAAAGISVDDGVEGVLVKALSQLCAGETAIGSRLALEAALELPMLRVMVLENRVPDFQREDGWHHGALPDTDGLMWTLAQMREFQPGAFKRLGHLYSDDETQRAANELKHDHKHGWARVREAGKGNLEMLPLWHEACKGRAKEMANAFVL